MRFVTVAALTAVSGYGLAAAMVEAAPPATAAQPEAAASTTRPAAQEQGAAIDDPAIVVTARRREESLAQVPISITVATQDTLERLAISSPETLTKLDPALTLANRQGSRDVFTPFIRGQGAASSAGAVPSVISYFAEVPFFRPSFVDLQNLQVLKGPQGTLFGETATGGAVLFTPRKPGNAFEGYVTGELGNHDYRLIEGAVTLPIATDVWSIRVAGQIRKRDGYTNIFFSQPGTSSVHGDNVDTTDLRLSSVLHPFHNLEIYTVLAHSSSDSAGTGYILQSVYDRVANMRLVPANIPSMAAGYQYFSGLPAPAGKTYLQIIKDSLAQQLAAGPRASFSSTPLDTHSSFTGVANQINWDVTPNVRLRNITGFFRSRNGPNSGLNPDSSLAPIADNIGAICIAGTSPSSCRVDGAKTLVNETQVQADLFGNRLNLQAGVYYRRVYDAPWTAAAQFVVVATSTGNNTTLSRSESLNYAGYAQGIFTVVDGVHVTAGIRKSWDQSTTQSTTGQAITTVFNGVTIPLSSFAPQPVAGATVTTFKSPKNSAVSYTLSADWQITRNVLAWVTHRRGYKPGLVNRLVPVTDPNYLYGPETLTDWEAGFRGSFDLGGMALRTSLVAYRGKYANIQRSSFGINSATGNYVQLTQNVAGATIKGLEFSLDVAPSRYFDVGVFVAYNKASFDNWLETQTCARQPFRAGCVGLSSAVAALTPVVIDHVAGTVTARGVTETFHPDVFAQAPKLRWNLRPAIHFGFLGEAARGATLSANVSRTSSHASADSNYTVGLAKSDTITPGYTLVDLRFDWRNLPFQHGLDFFAGVTNLFNKTARTETIEVTSTCDCVFAIYNEPRMVYTGLRYSF
ncbi:MAG: iron complex outerrane recepter protein [Sphingomonadales bacterium]|jgi:iron complex outermembrane receptor protein|nr:iron complex outerrane recepter protein [Sphingomonadales bacterium]